MHCKDPYTGRTVRYHVHEKALQRTVREAAKRAAIAKPVGCHTFRRAFATHLLESGHNIRIVQELMGHKDVETTMIRTHVMTNSLAAVRSPADALAEQPSSPVATECLKRCGGRLSVRYSRVRAGAPPSPVSCVRDGRRELDSQTFWSRTAAR